MYRLRMSPYALVFSLLGLVVGHVQAHDPGLSAAALRIADDQCTAHLTFARQEIEPLVAIDMDQDGAVTDAEFAAARASLLALIPEVIEITSGHQQMAAQSVAIDLDQSDALHFRLSFPTPVASRLTVRIPIVRQLARGHRHYISVRDAKRTLLAEHVLDVNHAAFALSLANGHNAARTSTSWQQFLFLGVAHLLTGYDHVLFLFGLLVVGGSFWQAWRIITSFTVAHSMTLALATLHLVQLPSYIVEPVIAGSIVYVGLENLLCHDLRRRWLFTFGFGLVHGLGFASVLRDLGVGEETVTEIVLPLLSFNVGVELGQVAMALLLLPLIWRLQQHLPLFPQLATVCSVLVMCTGTYWLLARTVWS